MTNLKVRKGDLVEVITGKDKGKRGKILRALPEKNRVVVEGLNKVKKAQRASQRNPQSGGIIEKEAPINVSNVMIVCPSCGKPTRVGNERTEDGARIRLCRKCAGKIDKG